MNCSQCGKRIWSDDRYCKNCGLNLQGDSSPVAANPLAEDSQLKGVGGWLLFFCIFRAIVGPILFITSSVRFGIGFIDVLVFIQIVIGVVVGIQVWSLSKSSFLALRIYFSATLLVTILQLFLSLMTLLYGENVNKIEAGFNLAACSLGLALTITWLAYFHFSDRVKATFGSNFSFLPS